MGQKVNPHGLRVGVIKDWDSRWYAEDSFADYLVEDYNIRKFLKKRLYSAGVSKIEIERASDRVKVIVYTAKPGVVIGKGGSEIEKVKAELAQYTDKKLIVDIKEIKRPDRDAQLVAENIALQLENRVSFRRAMKSTMSRTMKAGAKGIKTAVAGRVGGADMARTEFYSEGTIPLQTLRADIDYGFAEADTTYGKLGVKVWINHGEILDKGLKSAVPEEKEGRRDGKKRGDRRQRRDGDRRPRRDDRRHDRAEAAPKAVNMRVRKPKVDPEEEAAKKAAAEAQEAQAQEAQVEESQTAAEAPADAASEE